MIIYSILQHPERMAQLAAAGITRGEIEHALNELEADAENSPADFDPIGPELAKRPGRPRSITRLSIYRTVVSGLKRSPVRVDKHGNFMFSAKKTGVLSRKLRELNPADSYPERRREISKLILHALDSYYRIDKRRNGSVVKKAHGLSDDFHPAVGAGRGAA